MHIAVPDGQRSLLYVPHARHAYTSCEYEQLHLALERAGWQLVCGGGMTEAMADADILLLWRAYDAPFADPALGRRDRSGHRPLRCFYCDDIHYFDRNARARLLAAFEWADLILAAHPQALLRWFPELAPDKVSWLPHSAAPCFEPLYRPQDACLLLSAGNGWRYPFRQFCQVMLPPALCAPLDMADDEALPSLDAPAVRRARESRSQLMHRFPAMLTCGSVFGYLPAAVFEAMAAGCLVVAERQSLAPTLARLGFVDGEHFIGTDLMHVCDDARTVLELFQHRGEQWRAMVERAAEQVLTRHTCAERAQQLHRTCMALAA